MSEQAGEKTEQATPRRLEEAQKRGQFARSAEIQTVFVLMAGLMSVKFAGPYIWNTLEKTQLNILGHLHDIPLSYNVLQGYAIEASLVFVSCVGPIVLGAMLGGLIAGSIQNRFQTASEVLELKWERVNPVEGFKRIFSVRAAAPAAFAVVKMVFIAGLTYSEVKNVLSDPIFYSTVDMARIAGFLAESASAIFIRVGMGLALVAALDYTYQFWRTNRDLMMTRQEVKDEHKNMEGDPHIKARMRRRRVRSQRQMLQDVPKADVVVTNPTHFAVALRYDRKTMKAPQIVAKGTRLNALKIREIATKHQVPIVENKPLARMMFKYGKVGGEVPAQLYAAVAEVLAWVYRVNRYRYYAEQNQN